MFDTNTTIWFVTAILASAAPLPFLKQYTKTNEIIWVILSFLSYAILIFAYIQLLQFANMEIIYALIKISAILLVVLTGVFIFDSPFNRTTFVGILLACISLYLLTKQVSR